MTSSARRAEFFALEASEYIGDLEPIVARTDTPDLERLVRGARALRGAALMAGLGTFARAAAGMEGIARQVRDHALGWEPQARDAWREGLQTLRGLIGRATTWEAADDRQALALADRLERVAGGRSASPQLPATAQEAIPAAAGMTPGVRAFIARESALIAGSLQQAAQALAPTPPPEALAGVLERMRSLRGIGASADLSPLPELLDAMEVMTRGLITSGSPSPALAAVFASAADALATISRSVGDHGRVTVPPGLGEVARELLERHVVAVALPAPADPDDPGPVPVELVGVGDHLIAQADALDRQSSPSARDLRLFVLHRTLSTMPERRGTGRFLAPLARAITAAISDGGASASPDAFGTMLREAGDFLVGAAEASDPAALTARRDGLANAILHGQPTVSSGFPADRPALAVTETWAAPRPTSPDGPGGRPSGDLAAARTAAERPAAIVPIASLAPDDAAPRPALKHTQSWESPPAPPPTVSIASLAPDADAPRPALEHTQSWQSPPALPPTVPIASLAPDDTAPRPALEHTQSWQSPPAPPPVVSIASLAPDDTAPRPALEHTQSWQSPPAPPPVVPIASLAPDDTAPRPALEHTQSWESPPAPPPVVSVASSAPGADAGEPGRLERAYHRLRELDRMRGDEPPTLEGLTGAATTTPIEHLVYRGEAAVARAEELRTQLINILAEPAISLDRLRPILDELLDLVPLARDAS